MVRDNPQSGWRHQKVGDTPGKAHNAQYTRHADDVHGRTELQVSLAKIDSFMDEYPEKFCERVGADGDRHCDGGGKVRRWDGVPMGGGVVGQGGRGK